MPSSRFPARAFKSATSTSRLPQNPSSIHRHLSLCPARSQVAPLRPSPLAQTRTHTCRRCFQTSSASRSAPQDPDSGARPDQRPLVDQDDQTADDQHLAGLDGAGRRPRSQAISSLRSRQARKRSAADLPPFELPISFLENNVFAPSLHHAPGKTPLHFAMEQDLHYSKTAPALSPPKTEDERNQLQNHIGYFYHTLWATQKEIESLERELLAAASDEEHAGDTTNDVTSTTSDSTGIEGALRTNPDDLAALIRITERSLSLGSSFLECALQITNGHAPEGSEPLQYKSRPFWWWHVWKGLSVTRNFQEDPRTAKRDLFAEIPVDLDLPMDHSLDQCVGDLPKGVLRHIRDSLRTDFSTTAPKNYDLKNWKRPIPILAISGYGGRAISEFAGLWVAQSLDARLVRFNAYDLSVLLGEYLGQSWAYGRGTLSMLGFRCAELNGKIPQEEEADYGDEEEPTGATTIADVRAAAGSLEEELGRIKSSHLDVFSKWEILKIDKAIERLVSAAEVTNPKDLSPDACTIVQIDDVVELSMTLEGNWILSRIRAAVEELWAQKGRKITILGTSSCEDPSEEYQNAVEELASHDKVMTRHLKFNSLESRDEVDHLGLPRTENPNTIQDADYLYENVQNLHRMIRAMNPGAESVPQIPAQELLHACSQMTPPPSRESDLRRSILPASEVYALAQFSLSNNAHAEAGIKNIEAYYKLGASQQGPGYSQDHGDVAFDNVPMPKARHPAAGGGEDSKPDVLSMQPLNEYEKRIVSGRVNRDKLKVTFADVRVPKDTISALKTLTSLALLRPEAFSYGVLAKDKINGCLLYGPPGTGKTMLAKAVAKECGANMLEISGASINDKYVGESEKLVRAIFTLAKKLSPCVVFLDEADALLANRSLFSSRIAHREQLNQFLKEWDGMEENNAFLMVATNRPFDLDDAVLRRLPRKILVDLPTQADRLAILQIHLQDEQLSPLVSLADLAARTPLYSGSDLKNVCVAAAMAAVEAEHDAAAEYTKQNDSQEPYVYPSKRTLLTEHFERALKQIPSSISANMGSLKAIKGFDEEYGNVNKGKRRMGFGLGEVRKDGDANIRDGKP